jgi:hypothetical protein
MLVISKLLVEYTTQPLEMLLLRCYTAGSNTFLIRALSWLIITPVEL